MIKIRLSRVGRRNDPAFRIVVQDSRRTTRGRYLEIVGFYNPKRKIGKIEKERVLYWLSQGAQISDTVHNFLVREGIVKAKKIDVVHKKKEKKEESPAPGEGGKEDASATKGKDESGKKETEKSKDVQETEADKDA